MAMSSIWRCLVVLAMSISRLILESCTPLYRIDVLSMEPGTRPLLGMSTHVPIDAVVAWTGTLASKTTSVPVVAANVGVGHSIETAGSVRAPSLFEPAGSL